ncbi:MAG: uracil-DNA glycosylase [Bacteroidales bacterium]|nr:uracil-DNA glycosylase [Bacteroidales bacterium]
MSDISAKYEELKELINNIRACNRCRLSSGRIHAVCGEGNVNARLFFIAQAPGEMEDKAGKMFIGPTGKVFDELFSEISLHRNEVYMTNLIKCRLPKNRKPKSDEIELCGKYLEQEIEIIKPEFLIPLGYHATKYILNRFCNENISSSDLTGKLIDCNGQKIYPLRHPSAVLYNPSLKNIMVQDFRKISGF